MKILVNELRDLHSNDEPDDSQVTLAQCFLGAAGQLIFALFIKDFIDLTS